MIEDTLQQAESKMRKAIEVAKEEFSGIRTGRANPALVNRLQVDYYGTPTPLQQLAGISAPEARLLVVAPYDRNATAAIEKAIRNSDLGINPSLAEDLAVVTELTKNGKRQIVPLDIPRRYSPTAGAGTGIGKVLNRLTLHLSIGQAY